MRYRPFGATYGTAVSVVTLLLDDNSRKSARDWRELIEAAMATGINSFMLDGHNEGLLDGLAEAIAGIERRLIFLAWRAPTTGNLDHTTGMMLRRLDTDYIDLLVVEDLDQIAFARTVKHHRAARQIGVSGSGEILDLAIQNGGVDCLIAPYSLTSMGMERVRLKTASERNILVIARDVCPAELTGEDKPGLIPKGWFKKKPKISARSAYHFLEDTHNWTGEEICLAYALFEPAVTSVQMQVDSLERLARIAAVPERELPTGVAAQIEMARFSANQKR
jgi:aryl-alcohol dehydrogenase-like predicted oxidoreductase